MPEPGPGPVISNSPSEHKLTSRVSWIRSKTSEGRELGCYLKKVKASFIPYCAMLRSLHPFIYTSQIAK